jgi:hypothetical protein
MVNITRMISTTRDTADIEDDKFPSDPDDMKTEVPLIEDQTLFFNEDEDNDEPSRKPTEMHSSKNAMVSRMRKMNGQLLEQAMSLLCAGTKSTSI